MHTTTQVTRRALLRSGLKLFNAPTTTRSTQRDLLLCVFMRGAADGLNIVVPHGDAEYYSARASIAIPQPGKGTNAALDLDGRFGFHPALAAFKRLYDAKLLVAVHACGSPDPTHSHFDAMDYMERGIPGDKATATGWLGRHLQLTAGSNDSTLRAVGFGGSVQPSLRGPVTATAISSIAAFHLRAQRADPGVVAAALRELYGGGGALSGTAAQTFSVLEQLDRKLTPDYAPAHGAKYPSSAFGNALKQIAQIAKGDLGLEVACADIGGWDTHAHQGGSNGEMAQLLTDLGQSLEAFVTDLEDRVDHLTIVTMSEFGRRVKENASGGTDHGHGNCMFVIGGGVHGGTIYGDWPGLHADQLFGPGDLQVTTDFRDVLSEVVSARLGNTDLQGVFPGYQPRQLGLLKS